MALFGSRFRDDEERKEYEQAIKDRDALQEQYRKENIILKVKGQSRGGDWSNPYSPDMQAVKEGLYQVFDTLSTLRWSSGVNCPFITDEERAKFARWSDEIKEIYKRMTT